MTATHNYSFNVADSLTGSLGLHATVVAASPLEALAVFKRSLPDCSIVKPSSKRRSDNDAVSIMFAYIRPNRISLANITHIDNEPVNFSPSDKEGIAHGAKPRSNRTVSITAAFLKRADEGRGHMDSYVFSHSNNISATIRYQRGFVDCFDTIELHDSITGELLVSFRESGDDKPNISHVEAAKGVKVLLRV